MGPVFSMNTFAPGQQFIEVYFSFTIGMLKRLSGGIYRLAIRPP
jgi:hypothetical protein